MKKRKKSQNMIASERFPRRVITPQRSADVPVCFIITCDYLMPQTAK